MVSQLNLDQKILLLLHYERYLTASGKVSCEYTVDQLNAAFGVGKNYVQELRKRFMENGTLERKSGSGRPSFDKEERSDAVVACVREKRDITIRDIAVATSIPRSSVWRLLDDSEMKLCARRSIPPLNELQTDARLTFCRQNRYNRWDNWVDVDEKWFDLTNMRRKERYHADSPKKYYACSSKGNPVRLMVLAAVAKPMPEYGFDGLIGIWRITTEYVAQRSSKNHEKGDVYDIDTTMTSELYYDMMMHKVIPSIKRKMNFASNVTIQQDNARPHVGKNNVSKLNGVDGITVINQPANSPELNVNDLGFFHSLLATVEKHGKTSCEELWQVIQDSYNSANADTLLSIWKTKSAVVQEIIRNRGNSVKVLHSSLRRDLT